MKLAVGLPVALAISVSACNADKGAGSTDTVAARMACELFAENCSGCHGTNAAGDGPHSEHLTPPPTDLLSPASRDKGNEAHLAAVRDGVANTGMPAFVDLLSESEMQSTLDHVSALAAGSAATCDLPAADATGGSSGGGSTTTGGTDPTDPTDATATPDPTDPTDATTGNQTSGTTSAGTDATESTSGTVSPDCEAWCGCLEASCVDLAGYPFGSVDDCYDACVDLTAEELTCWTGFCEEVEGNPPLAEHLCEHAWGALGLNEC